ncbi:MAG: CDP-glycerol glycerophosphotransferase family protein [Lachnospiraceae bacterium]|nr:CDP-glycerol glycerophosphotransferase family protein [Lachnospiraceae bacterium]
MYFIIIMAIKLILRIVYFPMKKCIKVEKKIVYLSRQSNEKSLDMELLSKEIHRRYPDYKQVFRLKMIEPGLKSAISYGFWLLGDMIQIAGASVVICDTYSIPVSCLKHRKSLKIIQIWHAMGAIKQFGWQSVGRAEGRSRQASKILNMHANYDYVTVPSKATAQFYVKAFHTSMKKMKILTLPHIDFIVDNNNRKSEFYRDNPKFLGKEIILYLPTFRDDEQLIVESLQNEFAKEEQFGLIISLHPLSRTHMTKKDEIKGNYTAYDLMKLADYIITDYSACAFEASLLNKPLYFYTPDYETYKNTRGVNIDLTSEMSQYVYKDAKELCQQMKANHYDYRDLKAFSKKYIENTEHCTEKMADFICQQMRSN